MKNRSPLPAILKYFRYLKYSYFIDSPMTQFRLWQLFSEKYCIRDRHLRHIADARKRRAGNEELLALDHDAWIDESEIQDSIDSLVTSHLLRKANRRFLPIPERSEAGSWRKIAFSSRRVLTAHGVTTIREAIRSESKHRRDAIILFLSTLTGIIGALTGLLAVFLTKQ